MSTRRPVRRIIMDEDSGTFLLFRLELVLVYLRNVITTMKVKNSTQKKSHVLLKRAMLFAAIHSDPRHNGNSIYDELQEDDVCNNGNDDGRIVDGSAVFKLGRLKRLRAPALARTTAALAAV